MAEVYLITGGAGFIGSNIARRLLKLKQKVVVFDNLSTGKMSNLDGIKNRIMFIKGDITDYRLLEKSLKNIDYVLHQAALRSVPFSVDHPSEANKVNVEGTLNVLLAAKKCRVKRVVYASSSSVYGDRITPLRKEEMATNPVSPYAVSKLAAEHYCRMFYHLYGLETVSLRYFNVFGPYQDPNSQYSAVIPIFIKAIAGGKSPIIHDDGKQSRDFTYIDNVVSANILACKARGAEGEYFNVATGERTSVIEIFNKICKVLKKDIKPKFGLRRQGDVKHTLADISKAKQILKFKPLIGFDDGLVKTVGWFLKEFNEKH